VWQAPGAVRICLVYDRLHPLTLGGAERWMAEVGQRLAAGGHDVTQLTLRHWDRSVEPDVPGVRVVTLGPKLEAYSEERRRIGPPIVFGLCVFAHLLRHGRHYDVVHTASFPYFALLAIGLLRQLHGYRVVVDWHEVWTREYWREYLGRAGWVGWWVQRLCLRVPQRAFCFSQLHARRLREEGFAGHLEVLAGEYSGSLHPPEPRPADPVVVFAGRHIPDKQVTAVAPAIASARERLPGLRGEIYGDGPLRKEVERQVRELGLDGDVTVRGFVPAAEVDAALRGALCMLLPSKREGYGLVVVESSAAGVPSIVVRGPDNAATELVDDGENGVIARSASPEDLAEAILRVHAAGQSLRESTAAWFARNAKRLSLEGSLEVVAHSYTAA
jgi:glycosyltransferase involved in cell wall biosynthesis